MDGLPMVHISLANRRLASGRVGQATSLSRGHLVAGYHVIIKCQERQG